MVTLKALPDVLRVWAFIEFAGKPERLWRQVVEMILTTAATSGPVVFNANRWICEKVRGFFLFYPRDLYRQEGLLN